MKGLNQTSRQGNGIAPGLKFMQLQHGQRLSGPATKGGSVQAGRGARTFSPQVNELRKTR
jgi:hypothetical protein